MAVLHTQISNISNTSCSNEPRSLDRSLQNEIDQKSRKPSCSLGSVWIAPSRRENHSSAALSARSSFPPSLCVPWARAAGAACHPSCYWCSCSLTRLLVLLNYKHIHLMTVTFSVHSMRTDRKEIPALWSCREHIFSCMIGERLENLSPAVLLF